MKFLWTVIVCFLLVSCGRLSSKEGAVEISSSAELSDRIPTFMDKVEVQKFVVHMKAKHGYDDSLLVNAFNNMTPRVQVIHKSNNQPEVMTPYYKYKARFLGNARVEAGKDFLKSNKVWLDKAELAFGVPAEVIVAIIGVETFYGRITGNKDVLTSLSTLAFDYPRRGNYFRSELEAYLLLARAKAWPISSIKGSYSGALGMAQFMPSNYQKLAIDFDKDGTVDLWGSSADAIGSIANYLKHHGWQANQPILDKVSVLKTRHNSKEIKSWSNKQRKTFHYPSTWQKMGVETYATLPKLSSGLIRLQSSENSVDYWLAYRNFFALMSYNPSRRYTMAVIDLSRLIYDDNGVK
ncbi:lytic murein transglycosylase B [Marinomonas algicola]|uniref:lytic murein transglycosylase B n=1 Tax=Marinomonas algicola TaxID=2773454 RepID=UPI00174B0BFB|nr:lytic murein transglycosylase B [Marinomonas algicola]